MIRSGTTLALALVIALASLVPTATTAHAAHGWHATWVDQSAWPTLRPGMTTPYTVRYRNTGTETWQRGVFGRHVNLGVNGDTTYFADIGMAAGWPAATRVAGMAEATVPPGAIATFTFTIRAPTTPGTYVLALRPVVEGVTWLEDQGVHVPVVSDHGFHSRWVSQSPYPTLDPGQVSGPLTITFRNTGTRTWVRGTLGEQANLGVNGDDRRWGSFGINWPTPERPAVQSEASVPPGATGSFTFQLRAPSTPGTYAIHLRPVIDATTWMEDEGVFLYVTVRGAAAGTPALSDTVIQSGLVIPWDLAFAPDGRMFVTERSGSVNIYESAAAGAPRYARVPIAGVRASGEAGLMGIVFDPGFPVNPFIYLCASMTDEGEWRNQVLRYRVNGNSLAFDGYVIRRGMRAASNHDGCRLRFGPDGLLWVTMGEAGVTSLSQDPNSLNGKVLRVHTNGAVPADNPVLPGATGRSVIYSWGHRNPQGLAFEPGTGRPIEVEHGAGTHDEINILIAGGNYGWPTQQGPGGAARGFVDPIWSSGSVTLATSGADFATGSAWASWSGSLFVASLKESDLRRFVVSGNTATQADLLYNGRWGRLRTVLRGPDGALYLTTSNGSGDRVIRIAPVVGAP